MEGRLLLDVIVRQRATILELLAGENEQKLLVERDAFFVLDLCPDATDSIIWRRLQSDRLAGQRL